VAINKIYRHRFPDFFCESVAEELKRRSRNATDLLIRKKENCHRFPDFFCGR
jgi:hypothetical protein